MYRLRGRLLPLVYLNRALQLSPPADSSAQKEAAVNIVVLHADGRQFGLVVDEINDTEEIVVKPLGKQLTGVSVFAGATIMGDGKVALILDALGLAQRAHIVGEADGGSAAEKAPQTSGKSLGNRQTLLLLQAGEHGRMAILFSWWRASKEFGRQLVECAGTQQVVQYRGQIMPLLRVSQAMNLDEARSSEPSDGPAPLQVVVYAEHGRSIGLVVERILDIVEEEVVLERVAERDGILGSAVVQQHVTDLLDVPGLIRAAHPTWFAEAAG